MCGITGMAGGGILAVDLKVLEELTRVSTLRGTDATGIFQGRFSKSVKETYLIEKAPWEANHFFGYHNSSQGNKLLLNSSADNVFIGHVRDATRGALDETNCQPFQFGNVIGVHNGTLKDWKYQDNTKDGLSDSYLLYEDIAVRGVKAVVEELDPDSAYTLVFFDMNKKKLCFVRSGHRPLYAAKHSNRAVFYWASEMEMLEWVLKRHHIDYEEPVTFKPHRIYWVDPNSVKTGTSFTFMVDDYEPQVSIGSKKKMKEKKNQQRPNFIAQQIPTIVPATIGGTPITLTALGAELPWDDIPFGRGVIAPIETIATDTTHKRTPISHIKVKSDKIKHVNCNSCDKEMNLLDQYLGHKEVLKTGESVFDCAECAKLSSEIKLAMEQKHSVSLN
jgi:hypothetical protein